MQMVFSGDSDFTSLNSLSAVKKKKCAYHIEGYVKLFHRKNEFFKSGSILLLAFYYELVNACVELREKSIASFMLDSPLTEFQLENVDAKNYKLTLTSMFRRDIKSDYIVVNKLKYEQELAGSVSLLLNEFIDLGFQNEPIILEILKLKKELS